MENNEKLYEMKMQRWRSLTAQILAALSSGILMLNVANLYSVIVVVNGSLTDHRENHQETFKITENDASWYGSIIHLIHLVGSITAGLVQDSYGRKTCMLVSNFPQILGWIVLIYANSTSQLYISAVLMGVGASFGEVPVSAYISETTSADLRGRLFSFTKIGYGMGALFVFYCSIYLHWRTMATICLLAPIINACYLLIMPETPMWLLSKGKENEALKSLRWLRGWAPTSAVNDEFQKLKNYIKESKKLGKNKTDYLPVSLKESDTKSVQSEAWKNIRILSKKEFLQPYKLVVLLFLVSCILSLRVVKPYMLIILRKFDFSSPKILAVSSSFQIIGALTMATTVNRFGKKPLIFFTFNISAICLALIGLYGVLFTNHGFRADWLLYGLYITISYMTGLTIGGMPWYICGEIYPQQIRGIACGVSATTSHLMLFILVKLYVPLEANIGTSNVFFIYATVCVIGTLYLHFQLPETENKSLEEIEKSFTKTNNDNDDAVTLVIDRSLKDERN